MLPVQNALASVPVRDLKSACEWYERFLGRPPDSRPLSEVVEWKFEQGGWLQVYQLPERAGHGSVTLVVSDLEQQMGAFDRSAVVQNDPMKVVMIKDPDGNSIALTEAVDPTAGGNL
jgi:catechol 2,3-dioxygenase-like lactoylglutathione lyase family enzyme